MTIGKCKYIFASMLAAFSLLAPATSAVAAGNSLEFDGDSNKLVVKEDNDFFDNMKEMMPGGTATSTVQIKNNSDYEVSFYMYAKPTPNAESLMDNKAYNSDLLDKLELTITLNDQVFYNGPVSGDQNTQEKPENLVGNEDNHGVLLATLEANKEATLSVKLDVPSELTNEYMDTFTAVDWVFACFYNENVEETPTPNVPTEQPSVSATPTVTPTTTPTATPKTVVVTQSPDNPDDLADTGITTQGITFGAIGIVFVGLLVIDIVSKRKQAK